jgi:hypothetical protein
MYYSLKYTGFLVTLLDFAYLTDLVIDLFTVHSNLLFSELISRTDTYYFRSILLNIRHTEKCLK